MKNNAKKDFAIFGIATFICLIIGLVDIATSSKYRLYPFYLIPIYLIINYTRRNFVVVIFCISGTSMVLSEYIHSNSVEIHSIWGIFMVFIMYVIFIVIVERLRYDKKEIELKNSMLNRLLDEKSVLIRELYHRLKNNINELIALVSMQSENGSAGLGDQLKSKLYVYAKLFEKLTYDKQADAEVDVKEYLYSLTEILRQSYKRDSFIDLKIDSLNVASKHATTIGLIVNELVTNSMKNLPADEAARIDIELKQEGNVLSLHYHDNGTGFDYQSKFKDIDRHFGLFLIQSLVSQYNGDIEYCNDNGSRFRIDLIIS